MEIVMRMIVILLTNGYDGKNDDTKDNDAAGSKNDIDDD